MTHSPKASLPKLRFPEFQDRQVWITKQFSDVYEFKNTNSLSRAKLSYEHGEIRNIHYGDIHTKFLTLFDITKENVPFINPSELSQQTQSESFCREGDIILADASEDMDDIGKSIELINLNNEKVVSGLHTCLARQRDNFFVIGFSGYLFKSAPVRTEIRKEAQGAKVLGISPKRLAKISLVFSENLSEQQKITDCLSSLDELIAAHTDKLDALKTHKKGLLQQLFPREGETIPRLRFPEFRDSGNWESTALSTQASLISGQHLAPDAYSETGEIPYFTGPSDYSNDSSEAWKWTARTANAGRLGDTLITVKGSGVGALLYLLFDEVAMGRQLMAVRPKESSGLFLFYFLSTQKTRLEELGFGNLIPGLSRGDILGLKLAVPTLAEQQKIANCLSALDDRIAAQADRIEALKQHKKGLLQQLFPVMDEKGP